MCSDIASGIRRLRRQIAHERHHGSHHGGVFLVVARDRLTGLVLLLAIDVNADISARHELHPGEIAKDDGTGTIVKGNPNNF